jgi:hypothetical protein
MVARSFIHDLTPEDRLIHSKWARGVFIVYGSAVLLLIGIIVAECILAEPGRDVDATTASITQI